MTGQLQCILLIAIAGFVQAAFVLPIKYFRDWRWEQMWVAQAITCSLCALVWAAFLPFAFWRLAAALPLHHWVLCYGFGLLWGVGGVAYGLTVTRLGISFTYSFVFGVTILVGALLPFLLDPTQRPAKPYAFAEGLLLGLIGIVLIGLVHRGRRENDLMALPFSAPRYRWALCLAVSAGVFSACYGLAFSLHVGAVTSLVKRGSSTNFASSVVALPLYLGSASFAVPFGLVCARRTGTLGFFVRSKDSRNWALAMAMGICGVGGSLFYGWATTRQGHLPPNISYCILTILFIFAGNGIAYCMGELRHRSLRAHTTILASLACLIIAVWLLRTG
jgi:L-rhamnose-H+ transport protein